MSAAEHRATVDADAVIAFLNQRPDYIAAMRSAPAEAVEDYCRWAGHAEARRQLARALGLPVPHEPGEKAAT